jgi:hypothetical protein
MYAKTSSPVTLWSFPHTLAGDAAVTIILQVLITWFLEALFVSSDLKSGRIAPTIRYAPHDALVKWFVRVPGFYPLPPSSSEAQEKEAPGQENPSLHSVLVFVGKQLVRVGIITVFAVLIFWGPGVGILAETGTPEGKDFVYKTKWTPQVFKAVLGGILGLILGAGCAWFWMVRLGVEYRRRFPIKAPR